MSLETGTLSQWQQPKALYGLQFLALNFTIIWKVFLLVTGGRHERESSYFAESMRNFEAMCTCDWQHNNTPQGC